MLIFCGEDRKKTDFSGSMKWRTTINVKSELKMEYEDQFIFMGSCFSENISEKMKRHGFHVLCNPLGIMYNPISLAKSLELLLGNQSINEQLYLTSTDHVFHYDLHSQIYAKNIEQFEKQVGHKTSEFKEYINREVKSFKSLNVFITLGSAWVYKHKESGQIVANCHKQDARIFEKQLLGEQEIIDVIGSIKKMNFPAETNFIFTISPIRHIKDGIHENQVSKARLISAVFSLVQKNKRMHYFPAYELMMDDLRDYRFYKKDLLHPNEMAIDYIWSKFQESCLSNKTTNVLLEYTKLVQMKNHRVLFPDSEESKKFALSLNTKLETFHRKYPYVLSQ